MSESKKDESKPKKPLSLKGGTLSLKGKTSKAPSSDQGTVVEVRRKRVSRAEAEAQATDDAKKLTNEEREARAQALLKAQSESTEDRQKRTTPKRDTSEPVAKDTADDARQRELEELQRIEAEEQAAALSTQKEQQEKFKQANPGGAPEPESYRDKLKKAPAKPKTTEKRRRGGKITVTQVLNEDYDRDRGMSLAAQKRAREKARLAAQNAEPAQKVFREVILPETITVQELANRMTEPGGEVIKALMKMGVMATINETIDADTAELIIDEFGHKVKRVTEADVEEGVQGIEDDPKDLKPRPPVVTIMGHVDHGKTSLLDAMREANVVAGEAGGITQHIGAYQITASTDDKITFLDTPGHAAFTEMRARGADVTDIAIIVVAANDSIMPQTIEAINHAKAAEKPIIVAINKIDLPDSDPMKVKQDLLQHDVQIEDMGGDVQSVEISAKNKTNLDALEEAILLQAEVLELKANPDREAHGAVVESKMETGRGSVATVLIQNGTLKQGDIFVVGAEWGRVRALINDKGEQI
ncbi:MAG: translation initiation factor IF-2, partial [Pseudomonadota bacterium]